MTHRKPFPVTRRTALVSISAALTGAGTLALATQRADAAITFSQLDIPDAGFTSPDGEPAGIFVYADAAWEYDTGDATPAEYAVALYARDANGGFHALDMPETATTATADSGTVALAGDLLDTDAYAPADFSAPSDGSSKTVTVPFGVLLDVRDSAGSSLVKARATRDVDIMVTEDGVEAAIGADGQVAFQDDAGDPTPTAPP